MYAEFPRKGALLCFPLPLRTWVMGEAQLRCETIALTLLMLTNVDQFFFCNSQFECYFSLLGMAICGIRAPKSSLPSFFTFCTLTPFLHLLLLLRIAFSACSIYRNSCLPSGWEKRTNVQFRMCQCGRSKIPPKQALPSRLSLSFFFAPTCKMRPRKTHVPSHT